MFRACIHRGTRQIGGSCIEILFAGDHILLDLGKPLDVDEADESLLPNVAGLKDRSDNRLKGIVLSHGHIDHWGLAPLIDKGIPVAMGAATCHVLHATAPFVPNRYTPERTIDLDDGVPIVLGPFRITPTLVDHSAYDAYALLVEAGGRRLFYSGDIRGHGRKAKLFERLIHNPPKDVDVLLMEGSSLGRIDEDATFPSEEELEARFVDNFKVPGFVAVCASAQNIDRIVTIYRACKRTGRTLLLDLYAMEVLRATGNENLPAPGWPNLEVYIPEYQRIHVAKNKRFDLLVPYKAARIYREALADIGERAVMLFRRAMMWDADKANLWTNARAIWSQWGGYLKDKNGAGAKLRAALAERGVELETIHTSGHASIKDLKRLAAAIAPKALVPIHTFEGDRYPQLFDNVVRRSDGEWWEV